MDTHDLSVVSPTSSLQNQDGKSPRHLVLDVAAVSETSIDQLLLENYVLKTMIEGLIYNMMNGDAIMLAMYRTKKACIDNGLDEDRVIEIIQLVIDNYKKVTSKNPLDILFS